MEHALHLYFGIPGTFRFTPVFFPIMIEGRHSLGE